MDAVRCLLAGAWLVASLGPVSAQSIASMQLATELGDLLATETFCGLGFDQHAIASLVETRVKADDMGFSSTLRMMTDGAAFQLEDMTESQKTAHCTQTQRVAKSYGFMK